MKISVYNYINCSPELGAMHIAHCDNIGDNLTRYPELDSGSINAGLSVDKEEPSPEFLSSSQLTKKFNPLTKREVSSFTDKVYSPFTTHRSLIHTDTDFSRFTSHFSLKSAAFTLAEVLITLGIIGVVAAMTMPTLIQNYRNTVLHNQFKKGYSNLSKAFLMLKEELGTSDIRTNYATWDAANKVYPNSQELYNAFYKIIGTRQKVGHYKIYNYTKDEFWTSNCGTGCPQPLYLLEDGSSINMFLNSSSIYFDVDTNGPYKGPNRYGFDVFTFEVGSNDAIVPKKMTRLYTDEELENETWPMLSGVPCSIKSSQQANGIGCSYYALNDINPDDNTKTYWKNLPW